MTSPRPRTARVLWTLKPTAEFHIDSRLEGRTTFTILRSDAIIEAMAEIKMLVKERDEARRELIFRLEGTSGRDHKKQVKARGWEYLLEPKP